MKLTHDQIEILKDGKIEENRFYLQSQLDRKQYKDINEVLETIGLKWNRGKNAHIVEGLNESELKQTISDICETGELTTLKETIKKFQFYATPKEVAEYLVELADIQKGEWILEPSAGRGNIVDEILKSNYGNIVLTEIDVSNITILKDKYKVGYGLVDVADNRGTYGPEYRMNIYQGDFLEGGLNKNHFHKIIMNPPFSNSQDIKHILEAYTLLEKGGRIVSIASSSIQTREGKLYDELKALNPEYIELPEGSFKESGTMVNTVIVIINKE